MHLLVPLHVSHGASDRSTIAGASGQICGLVCGGVGGRNVWEII